MTEGSAAVALRFEILGPVRAYRGDEPVDPGPVKQQALLALLLLNAGKPVPMHRIVATLWGSDPPENGIDIVQRYVGALRRTLDPERTSLLAFTDGGYVLRAGKNAIDAERFRARLARARTHHQTGNQNAATDDVRRALDLWQAEPLAGLTGPVFESARARLNEERVTAAQLLAQPTRPQPAAPQRAQREPAPTKRFHAEPAEGRPAYPEPVDPWTGHDLFPPDWSAR